MGSAPARGGPSGSSSDPEPASILVVAGRESCLTELEVLLEPLNRRVTAARSAADAVRRLHDEAVAVILVDVQARAADGFEAVRQIRGRPAARAVPIILVTATPTASERAFPGVEAGIVDQILTPINATLLRSRVSVLVELHEANARLQSEAVLRERMAQLQEATAALASALTVEQVTASVVEFARRIAGAGDVRLVELAEEGRPIDPGRPVIDRQGRDPALIVPLIAADPPRALVVTGRGPGGAELTASRELLAFAAVAARAFRRAQLHESDRDARARHALVADVSAALDARLETGPRLAALAEVLVPALADACVIELRPDRESAPRRAGAVASPRMRPYLDLPVPRLLPGDGAGPGASPPGRMPAAGAIGAPVPGPGGPPLPPPHAQVVVPLRARQADIGTLWLLMLSPDRDFAPLDLELAEEIGRRAGLAIDNARLYELQEFAAITLQRSLLPQSLPGSSSVALAARYASAASHTEAGGDWFEAVDLDGNGDRVILAVGDVVGRGIEAAAAMGQLRSAARAYARQGLGPGEIVSRLNRFASDVPGAAVSTVACAEIRPDRNEIAYVCAGHPPPLLVRPNGWAGYLGDGRGPPLGLTDDAYREAVAPFAPGDRLIMYSDGAIERRDEWIDHGLDRLARVASHVAGADEDVIADAILERVGPGASSTDDVALLIAGYRPPPDPVRLRFPARPDELAGVRRAIRSWLSTARFARQQADDLLLCAMEACAASIERADVEVPAAPAMITVRLALVDRSVEIAVHDGRRWPRHAAPSDGGYGLGIIRRLMDAVDIHSASSGTSIRMRAAARYAHIPVRLAPAAAVPVPDPPSRPVSVDVVATSSVVRGSVRGELDDAAVGIAQQQLEPHIGAARQVVVDLAGVTLLSARGVGWLLDLAARLRSRGATLLVISPPGSISRRVLGLFGVGLDARADEWPDAMILDVPPRPAGGGPPSQIPPGRARSGSFPPSASRPVRRERGGGA